MTMTSRARPVAMPMGAIAESRTGYSISGGHASSAYPPGQMTRFLHEHFAKGVTKIV
jgi:hypothetical protein